VILALTACTNNSETGDPTINTDMIAGYWSGTVAGYLDSGDELPPRDIGILIIADCSIGDVCGKFSEGDQCPGDIILKMVDGNRYSFLSETVIGTRHICGEGNTSTIDLELLSDGTIYLVTHNGATLTGILQRK
jgi:hypothetical protein